MSLVLTRRVGEQIRIGDDIVIIVTKISGNQVKLAIQAPRGIPINRQELWLSKQEKSIAKDPTSDAARGPATERESIDPDLQVC